MPFRRYFAARGADHPLVYSMLVLVLGMLVAMYIAVRISVQASDRAIRQNREQERVAQEKARIAACVVIDRMVKVYTDPTPPTITGRQARDAWMSLGVINRCEEQK